jgi:steroid 5-alpha reductase family enzyme
MYAHETQHPNYIGDIKIGVSTYFCLISSHAAWDSKVHINGFVFLMSLVFGAIINEKILMKHL